VDNRDKPGHDEEAEKLGLLRQAWCEGVDSGEADAVDCIALKQEARARLATKP